MKEKHWFWGKNILTNSRPIPLEAPWTKETPLAWEDDEEEKALLASDKSRGEREAMEVLWVLSGGGNSDSNRESYEREKNMKAWQDSDQETKTELC